MPSFLSRLRGYAIALALTAAAAAATVTLSPVIAGTPSVLLVGAVFLTTWLAADIGPGLLSIALGAIPFDYLFVDSAFSLAIETLRGAVGLLGFVGVNLLITILTASLRRDIQRRTRDQAERD